MPSNFTHIVYKRYMGNVVFPPYLFMLDNPSESSYSVFHIQSPSAPNLSASVHTFATLVHK
jgi:hypothetical protein